MDSDAWIRLTVWFVGWLVGVPATTALIVLTLRVMGVV